MQTTEHIGLKKPDDNDFYNVQDINDNMDIIDEKIHEAMQLESGVTGVKGSEETEYRKGQVEISAKDVGAIMSEKITESIDFNAVTETGVYHINTSSVTNRPTSHKGTLIVEFSIGTPYQIWVPDAIYTIYKRIYTKSTSTWSDWVKMDAGNAEYATKALQDDNGKVISNTYLSYGGYYDGTANSVNDILTPGISRIYIAYDSEDHKNLGIYGQCLVETSINAGLIFQKITDMVDGTFILRRNSTQGTIAFDYTSPYIVNRTNKYMQDLGNHSEAASGTTGSEPTEGMLLPSGLYMTRSYRDSNAPASYGNIINIAGSGTGQLFCEWAGSDNTTGSIYYRSHRDTTTGGWGPWEKLATSSDIDTLKTSFQDGCSKIATAITNNGVSTASNASPDTMATNIGTLATNKYNAGVSATKKGTAVASDVLSGKTFTNSSSVGANGTMANKGGTTVDASAVSKDDNYTYLTIPANGYYSTNSKVRTPNSNVNKIDSGLTAISDMSKKNGAGACNTTSANSNQGKTASITASKACYALCYGGAFGNGGSVTIKLNNTTISSIGGSCLIYDSNSSNSYGNTKSALLKVVSGDVIKVITETGTSSAASAYTNAAVTLFE